MSNRIRFAMLAVVLMSTPPALAGAFSKKTGYGPDECHPSFAAGCYIISGEITQKDADAIERLILEIERRKLFAPIFTLDSNGGDVMAAMQIGRALRRTRAVAVMGEIHTCLSACVLVLAGATQRWVHGTIGIHRPYSTNVNIPNYTNAQSAYRQTAELVKRYLQEMNLSDSLYDAMARVPPENIKVLTEFELTAFGLNQIDPAQQELDDAYEAKRYGISRQELLQRKNQADSTCFRFSQDVHLAKEYTQCKEKIMRGVR